ncbi:unnamed protein product [Arabidopsis halleri]
MNSSRRISFLCETRAYTSNGAQVYPSLQQTSYSELPKRSLSPLSSMTDRVHSAKGITKHTSILTYASPTPTISPTRPSSGTDTLASVSGTFPTTSAMGPPSVPSL